MVSIPLLCWGAGMVAQGCLGGPMMRRRCAFQGEQGRGCGAPPLRDGTFCLMHDPAHAAEVQESRRLGGIRRRRELTLSGAYEFDGLTTVSQIRRILEIATLDTLGLENSVNRARTLIAAAQAAAKLLETGELEERIAILEAAVRRERSAPSVFEDAAPAASDAGVWQ